MESEIIGNTSKLIIQFTTILRDPFGWKYKFSPIKLDPASFTDEGLRDLKSIKVITKAGDETPDLEIISVFELNVDITSGEYKKLINEAKPGPPIEDGVFYGIENKHKTLTYSLVKYIAWRNGIHVDKPYTKIKDMSMNWKFNGVNSTQTPKPQFEFEHYISTQVQIPDLSAINFQYFYKLYDAGLQIPVHQELLIEAKYLMGSQRRRSAYLLLYSALEVATKSFIVTKKPDTDYLIDKMQSPDLKKLYSDYINEKIEHLIDKEGKTTLIKMAEIRNKIAHQGQDVGMTDLDAHYRFVSSLIKKLEISLGYV